MIYRSSIFMFTLLAASLVANAESFPGAEALTKSASFPKKGAGLMHQVSETKEEPETEDEKRKRKFYPIGLKCPKSPGNGLLEIIKKNRNGAIYRGRFHMAAYQVHKVTLETAMPGKKFETIKDLNLDPSLNEPDKEFARNSIKTIDPLLQNVCEGNAEKKSEFYKALRNNNESFEIIEKFQSQSFE